MSDTKSITIKIRVDSQTYSEIRSRADRYTDGNLSAFVRCATLKYNEQPVTDHDNPRMIALIKSAIKLIERIGTNTNQVAKHINEQQKMNPYSLREADLLPFSEFCESTDKIRKMLAYLVTIQPIEYNRANSNEIDDNLLNIIKIIAILFAHVR